MRTNLSWIGIGICLFLTGCTCTPAFDAKIPAQTDAPTKVLEVTLPPVDSTDSEAPMMQPELVEVMDTPLPSFETTPLPSVEKQYTDQVGWIIVPNTNIDYPILYGEDYFYHYHDENGNESDSGSIYAYYNALCRNNVVAGHNARTSKTRFHELHKLQDRILEEAVEGKATAEYEIYCSLFGLETWRIFAMYETPSDEPTKTLFYNIDYNCNNAVTDWITTQIERSEVDFGHVPNKQNRFLTLETCGDAYDAYDAQSRLYFFLYCVDP